MTKFSRRVAIGGTLVASCIFMKASAAEEGPRAGEPAGTLNFSAVMPDLSKHPLAGGEVQLTVCATDGFHHSDCSAFTAVLPLPKLNNPLGYEVQELRQKLAMMIVNAEQGDAGQVFQASLRQEGQKIIESFGALFDQHATDFSNYETLNRFMDLDHAFKLAVESYDTPRMNEIITDLYNLVLQLEEDLLTPAEKAMRDARKALEEAYKEGADEESIAELNKQMLQAMKELAEERSQDDELSEAERKEAAHTKELLEELQKLLAEMEISPEEFTQMIQSVMSRGNSLSSPSSGGEGSESSEEIRERLKRQIEHLKARAEIDGKLNQIVVSQQELRNDTIDHYAGISPTSANGENTLHDRQVRINSDITDFIGFLKKKGYSRFADYIRRALPILDKAKDLLSKNVYGEAANHQDAALDILDWKPEERGGPRGGDLGLSAGDGSSSGEGVSAEGHHDFGALRYSRPVTEEGEMKNGGFVLPDDIGVSPRESEERDIRRKIIDNKNEGDSGHLDRLLAPS